MAKIIGPKCAERRPSLSARFLAISVYATLLGACATTPSPKVDTVKEPVAEAPVETPAPVVKTPQAPVEPEVEVEPKEDVKLPKEPEFAAKDGLTPPHMNGRNDIKRVALLLPLSARYPRLRDEAQSMLKAAEMAVFDRETADVLLMVLDTAGSPSGARAATKAAVDAGVDVVLGPLLGPSVKASGKAAKRSSTPVLGFSTDHTAAGNGVYLLSFPPEAEVERITQYAASQGLSRFAALGPDSAYGRRVAAAYERAVKDVGGELTAEKSYKGNDISAMQVPAKALAGEFNAVIRTSKSRNARRLFDAIILPEGGTALRSVAPLLTYYSSEMASVKKMGTGRWNDPDTALEPALRGGIFAGPDLEPRKVFEDDYKVTYNDEPSRLASLAYDAVNIGTIVAQGNPKLRASRMIDPRGFYGVDGFVRFRLDGTAERGLAVYEVQAGRFEVIEPAPKTAEDLGL